MDVALLSIAVDSRGELGQETERPNIQTPILSDEDAAVTKSYGIPLSHGGEPGHTFVLVGKDGRVKWAKDYAAPQNGGLMYVKVDELRREVASKL